MTTIVKIEFEIPFTDDFKINNTVINNISGHIEKDISYYINNLKAIKMEQKTND